MKILATANTLERLKKYIRDYTHANEVLLRDIDGKTRVELVYKNFGVTKASLSDRFEVMKHRGGFAFVDTKA